MKIQINKKVEELIYICKNNNIPITIIIQEDDHNLLFSKVELKGLNEKILIVNNFIENKYNRNIIMNLNNDIVLKKIIKGNNNLLYKIKNILEKDILTNHNKSEYSKILNNIREQLKINSTIEDNV